MLASTWASPPAEDADLRMATAPAPVRRYLLARDCSVLRIAETFVQVHLVVVTSLVAVVVIVVVLLLLLLKMIMTLFCCYSRSVASYTRLVSNDREFLQHYKWALDS